MWSAILFATARLKDGLELLRKEKMGSPPKITSAQRKEIIQYRKIGKKLNGIENYFDIIPKTVSIIIVVYIVTNTEKKNIIDKWLIFFIIYSLIKKAIIYLCGSLVIISSLKIEPCHQQPTAKIMVARKTPPPPTIMPHSKSGVMRTGWPRYRPDTWQR